MPRWVLPIRTLKWTASWLWANCTSTSPKLIEARRTGIVIGQDDLLSILAAAEVDGEMLSDADLLNFSFLLLVAGTRPPATSSRWVPWRCSTTPTSSRC